MVETTIDLAKTDYHEYHIKPDFDEGLKGKDIIMHFRFTWTILLIVEFYPFYQELRLKMDAILTYFPDELIKVSNELHLEAHKKLKLENNHQYGYYFRISRNDAGCLRSRQQYIELTTQKNGVYFTTSSLKSMSDKYAELTRQYDIKQSSLVKEVIAIGATYALVLSDLNQVIAELDTLVSFADASVKAPIPYVRPKIHPRGTGDIILKASRHPCLEVQEDVSFIPNHVTLLRNYASFHIITGPNMGGKSTFIRQIATTVLMAQIGCFVPCDEAQITVSDCILARVGAGDSQLKGISTFMAEMLETASILEASSL
jgi:DNA mismatch repair protein MSH2